MNSEISDGKRRLADIGLLYAAAIWGATFFLVKGALAEIDPVILVGYRFFTAGLVLLVYLIIKKKNVLVDLKQGIFMAILLWFLYIPQTIGLKYTTASNSGFITGLFVAFIPIFLKLIIKRNPTLMEVVASIVSLIGLWILTGGMVDINSGDILTLIAAMTYALHVLYADKFLKAGLDPLIFSAQQFLLVGLFSLITGLIFNLPFAVGSTDTILVLLFLILFPTLSAFIIQMLAQKIVAPVRVSLIFALEPVFAALFAWTLGGELFIFHRAAGGLLIFLALIISGLPIPKKINLIFGEN
jgi:drug/metabolite transporter (DMT)-like permease